MPENEATDTTETDESDTEEPERPDAHLDDVDDGCGCAEVWEHLSERRDDDG